MEMTRSDLFDIKEVCETILENEEEKYNNYMATGGDPENHVYKTAERLYALIHSEGDKLLWESTRR